MQCQLTASVSGDPAPLYELVNSVSGSGCVIWPDIDPRLSVETTIGLLLRPGNRGGARTYEEARHVAADLAARVAERIAREQRAREIEPHGCPFDLQAIRPIPREVLLAGYGGGGKDWLLENWGVAVPLSGVDLKIQTAIESEPRGRGRPRSGSGKPRAWTTTRATWSFVSETFPWACFRLLLRSWPGVEFAVEFTDEFGLFARTWAPIEIVQVRRAA